MFFAILAIAVSDASFLFSMIGQGGAMMYVPILKWEGFSVKDTAILTALLLNAITSASALIPYF